MPSTTQRPSFSTPEVREEIMRLRSVDNVTNLRYLAWEYLCIAAVLAWAIVFGEYRGSWGLSWWWNLPVFGLAIVLVGGLQHRLAGLGHESAHYTFLRNKFLNDFIADVFCMFPILATIHFYRLFHMAHHQYTMDPERDPDLVNMGHSKRIDELPMPPGRFILVYYLSLLLSPISFFLYQWDYIYVNVLGKGGNVYMRDVPDGDAHYPGPRLGTVLGLVYLAIVNAVMWGLTSLGHPEWLVPAGALMTIFAGIGVYLLPNRMIFQSPFRQPYSPRFASVVRLGYYTALVMVLSLLRWQTDGRSTTYFFILWVAPLTTTFILFMLLRDVYQHANADSGRLTNSRVFFCDPLTRWAVFVYGQDMHVPHHLFPAVPHYALPDLHRFLKQKHSDYATQVIECHGTFANHDGFPTILDEMSAHRPNAVKPLPAASSRPTPSNSPREAVLSQPEPGT